MYFLMDACGSLAHVPNVARTTGYQLWSDDVLLFIGYGASIIVVGVTAGLKSEGYGNQEL